MADSETANATYLHQTTTMNDDPSTHPSKNVPGPSLLACLLCRHKHLKCDGQTPVCGRCQVTGSECLYTPSRRGYNSKKRRANPSTPEQMAVDLTTLTSATFDTQSMELLDISPDWSLQGGGLSYAPAPVAPATGAGTGTRTTSTMPSSSLQSPSTTFLTDVFGEHIIFAGDDSIESWTFDAGFVFVVVCCGGGWVFG